MWDKGWTKIYEVYPGQALTEAYRDEVAGRLAAIIACLHPIFAELRGCVGQVEPDAPLYAAVQDAAAKAATIDPRFYPCLLYTS